MSPRLLPKKAAAEYLGIGERTFEAEVQGQIPVIRFGRSAKGYRYDIRDLDNWVDAQPKMIPASVHAGGSLCRKLNPQDLSSGRGLAHRQNRPCRRPEPSNSRNYWITRGGHRSGCKPLEATY